MILSEQEKNRILQLHTTSRNVNGSLISEKDMDDVKASKTLSGLASLADTGSGSGGSGSGGSGGSTVEGPSAKSNETASLSDDLINLY